MTNMKRLILTTCLAFTVAAPALADLVIPPELREMKPNCPFEDWKPFMAAPIAETDPAKAQFLGWWSETCPGPKGGHVVISAAKIAAWRVTHP